MTDAVTAERLREVDATWVVKRPDAPLTVTEAAVLAKIPAAGLTIGWVSRALVYAPIIRSLFYSRPERRALYSLLARGVLRVDRLHSPDSERIVRVDKDRS